jgi:hypothetical protein
MARHLRVKERLSGLVQRKEHEPRGRGVQALDGLPPRVRVAARTEVVLDEVRERGSPGAVCMHDEARRLVHGEQDLILKDDREMDV